MASGGNIDPRNLKAFSTAPEEDDPTSTDRLLIDRAGTIKYATLDDIQNIFPTAPTFAVDSVQYTADGSTTTFTLPTGTTEKATILAFVNGIQTKDFTLATAGNTITFNFTPDANNLVDITVMGISAGTVLRASGNIQFVNTPTSGTVTEIDMSEETNWTNWAVGNGWTGETVRFTGTAPNGLSFTFANNAGKAVYITDTNDAGGTLDIGTLPMAVADQHVFHLSKSQTTGLLYGMARGWRGGSGHPPSVQDLGAMSGGTAINVRLGETITCHLDDDTQITTLTNARPGKAYDIIIDLNGYQLTFPQGETLRGNPDSTPTDLDSADGGLVWFQLLFLGTEDTAGSEYYLHVKERMIG